MNGTVVPLQYAAFAGGIALGLMWGWVTRREGSIRGAVASRVTLNFGSHLWVVLLA